MPIDISSKDNERIKYTKSLLKSKNRQKESKYIIEGYRILTLAIECNANFINTVSPRSFVNIRDKTAPNKYQGINESVNNKYLKNRPFIVPNENSKVSIIVPLFKE